MDKFQQITSVVNGKFKRNRNMILQAIKSYEGKDLLLTFERPKKKRSDRQNRYYWGVLVALTQRAILDTWGEVWSIDKTHAYLKENFCYSEKVNEETGEVIRLPKSTTENTTTEQEEYHLQIRQHLLEWFGVNAPLPDEEITLNFDN